MIRARSGSSHPNREGNTAPENTANEIRHVKLSHDVGRMREPTAKTVTPAISNSWRFESERDWNAARYGSERSVAKSRDERFSDIDEPVKLKVTVLSDIEFRSADTAVRQVDESE